MVALVRLYEAAERMRKASNVTATSSSRIYADFDLGYVNKFAAALAAVKEAVGE